MLCFRLIFFRKDFLNSLPHKLKSQPFYDRFLLSALYLENREINFDVGVAVHVVES